MNNIDDDGICNDSKNETFEEVAASRMSRRGFIGGGAAAAAASVSAIGALLSSVPDVDAHYGPSFGHGGHDGPGGRGPLLGFQGIPVSTADEVVVPPGYTAKVLVSWGDPVSNGPAFAQDASNSAADQAKQWGMHNDGLVYFPIDGSDHGLIVQNNEYTDDVLLFPDGVANWTQEKTNKSLNAHGVSIIEVKRGRGHGNHWWPWHHGGGWGRHDGEWRVVRPSKYARRITGMTPIHIGGPAAGDARLKTSADPAGKCVLGTLNNCAMGYTPWGTYLACEENFNGYFRKIAAAPGVVYPPAPVWAAALESRYGVVANPSSSNSGFPWATTDSRFNVNAEPNEPNRFGWVVEIDPFDCNSTPVKRTALGRMKHEGAWVQEARDGRVVVYMGDDQAFEYIYRYVSRLPWRRARRMGINPLDDGTLYVAKFHANGSGQWLPLTPANPALAAAGWSLNDILINTRGAADLAGATKMDRPEWIDTFPKSLTAIATLTNNSSRGVGSNPGVDNANPRGQAAPPASFAGNPYGHIIRWRYDHDWTEPTFDWDIFALCGDPTAPAAVPPAYNATTVIGDKYGSPDGLYVAPSGRLWIQTDVSGSTINSGAYAGFGNNQMLCANPYTKETRRFLVGPKVCEVTGVQVTPDEKTMFVGIQHPGEAPSGANDPTNPKQFSNWPGGPTSGRPRSSLIVITKDDGGQIGS